MQMNGKSWSFILPTTILLLLAAGCGKSNTNPGNQPTVEDKYCTAYCDYRFRCTSYDRTLCMTECKGWNNNVFQDTYLELMTICLTNMACTDNYEECYASATRIVSPGCLTSAANTECMGKYTACQGTATPFMDDYCPYFCIMTTDGTMSYGNCLTKDCADVTSCFKEVLGRQ